MLSVPSEQRGHRVPPGDARPQPRVPLGGVRPQHGVQGRHEAGLQLRARGPGRAPRLRGRLYRRQGECTRTWTCAVRRGLAGFAISIFRDTDPRSSSAGRQVTDRGLLEAKTAAPLLQPEAQRGGGVPGRAAGRPPLLPLRERAQRAVAHHVLRAGA